MAPAYEPFDICLYREPRYHLTEMRSLLFVGIIVTMAFAAATTAGFGFTITIAQMADNATMGNMTGGNITMGAGNTTTGNSTETGSISGTGGPGF
jgi:hypothetical protein